MDDSSSESSSGVDDSDDSNWDLTASNVSSEQHKFGVIQCLSYVLYLWYVKWRISDSAFAWLLKILYAFFVILGRQHIPFSNEIIHFPCNLSNLLKYVQFDKQFFKKFIVCPNPECTKLYMRSNIITLDSTGQSLSLSLCTHCSTKLVKEKKIRNGKKTFHPLKIYCYRSILDSLKLFLSRSEFRESCMSWRKRETLPNSLGDIYDGKIWKRFASSCSLDENSIDLGLMLNCDWFQPFKRRSNISIGVLYLVVANLPWSMRFQPANVLLLGVLPALSKEPSSLNTFLQPAIEELLTLQKGVVIDINDKNVTVTARLLCTSSDIPATRKLGGFLGHSATLGCSKCLKQFTTMTVNGSKKRNYSGFVRDRWTPRTNEQHRSDILKISAAPSKSARQKLEKKLGCRYSALLKLDYFDPIVHHVVDPMHNLFLGTAKKMFFLWIDHGLLSFSSLKVIEARINSLPISSEFGRIPSTISSNSGNFTAEEWKHWTLVYSLYCLQGLLPSEHLICWQTFVLACQTLCKPLLFSDDVTN